MSPLLVVGILIIFGLLSGKIANKLKLPGVTGYLLLGLSAGPSLFGLLPAETVKEFSFFSPLALALIAFSIGREFKFGYLKQVGAGVALITVAEGIAASTFVVIGMRLLARQPWPLTLLFGALACATAPAATIVVMRENRCEGPLTRTLLSVVALDDALAIVVFALFSPVAAALVGRSLPGTMANRYGFLGVTGHAAALAAAEILGSVGFGTLAAFLLVVLLRRLRRPEELLAGVLGTAILTAGIASALSLSPLLTNMALGMMLVNIDRGYDKLMQRVDEIALSIYIPFFVLAGASLDLRLLPKLGLVGVIYLTFRSLGKIVGAGAGAKLARFPPQVQKYLGLALQPQAGVAIGLAMMVRTQFPDLADTVTTVIMATVMVYELIGPVLAKIAVTRAGEVGRAKQ